MLNGILSLGQLQLLPNRSDFRPVLGGWYRTLPLPNYDGFSCSTCNGCCMTAGNVNHSTLLVPSHFGLVYVLIVETSFPIPAMIFSAIAFQLSLGTLLLLLWNLISAYRNLTLNKVLYILKRVWVLLAHLVLTSLEIIYSWLSLICL